MQACNADDSRQYAGGQRATYTSFTHVDDGRERRDSGLLDRKRPGTRVGVASTRDESRVARVDDHADQNGAEDVEERDPVRDAAGGFRDRTVRVLGFGGGDDDGLDTDETERGVDEGGHETEEVTLRSGDACQTTRKVSPGIRVAAANELRALLTIEVGPGARVVPVAEANPLMVRRAAESDDERSEDQPEEASDLDDSRDNLGFSVAVWKRGQRGIAAQMQGPGVDAQSDGHEVDEEDQGEADGNDECGRDVGPVRDDDGCGRDLGRDGDGVAVSVTKSCGNRSFRRQTRVAGWGERQK